MLRVAVTSGEQIAHRLFASFPWYDLPEMHAANDALWRALAASLVAEGIREVPDRLDRERPHGVDPVQECLFTQTCGYPLFTTARRHFTVLGAPCYSVLGCEGPLHRSFIVVHDASSVRTVEDLRGGSFAINEADSNSGMNLPRRLFAPLARNGRFFGRTVLTGSHAASASLVDAGGVDSAAIDCVTFALLERYRPAAVRSLRIVAETAATPAPPLVTSCRTSDSVVAALRRALKRVVRDHAHAELRDALFLADVEFCGEEAYEVVMAYERDAVERGYPALA